MDLALDVRPATPARPTAAPAPAHPRRRRRHGVLVTAAVAATAVAGSAGVTVDTPWFRSLTKPRWYPPSATFPVVWTGLYAAIGWAATRALDRAPAGARADVARSLATNLVLNAGWTWAFFRHRRTGLATGVAAALTASTIGLLRRVGRHDAPGGRALVPYLAWTAFATVLSEEIWFRNRR